MNTINNIDLLDSSKFEEINNKKVNFIIKWGNEVCKGILVAWESFDWVMRIYLYHNNSTLNGWELRNKPETTDGFKHGWCFASKYYYENITIFTWRYKVIRLEEVIDGFVEVSKEGKKQISESDDGDIVKWYHTKVPLIFHRREKEPLKRTDFFGIEIEHNSINDDEDIKEWMRRNQDFFHYERDGSLDDGIETISQPFSELYYHARGKKKIADFIRMIPSEVNSYDTVSSWTWLHIHISRASLKEELICKLYFFLNNPEWRKEIKKIAGRDSERWAQPKDNCMKKNFKDCKKENGDRYVSLNLENEHTIEIRIFKSSSIVWKILGRIEFTMCLLNYLRLTEGRYWNWVSFDKFVEFAVARENEYPNLFKLLVSNSIVGWVEIDCKEIEQNINN